MAILDALGQHLEDESIATLATDLFLSVLPDAPDVCVALFEDNGTGPLNMLGNNMVAVERPRIRVYCRAGRNDYVTARNLAVSVRDALSVLGNQTIDGLNILAITPTSDVYLAARDTDDRPVIACDFVGWVK